MTTQEQTEIAATIATFPKTFGLRGFAGDTFRVSPLSSYFSGKTIYLYTERLSESGMWQSFAKGTVSELRAEITHRCTCGEGNLPGLAHCEHCPANHIPSVPAVATVAANDKPAQTFNASTRTALIGLLWDSLKPVTGHPDRRQTQWGTKTKDGLVACIDRIVKENQ